MDSNWEESHGLLGDRNHALDFSATSTTTSTPIYVGGTSSRESIFRLPNFRLCNLRSVLTTTASREMCQFSRIGFKSGI